MEPSTLQEILGVEKDIRTQLDAERTQAGQWLEAERREIDSAHAAALEALHRASAEGEAGARQAAAQKAAQLLARVEEANRAVAAASDEDLRRRVRPALEVLVPGGVRAR
ncbi:MAG TPA: hypothetical protein VMT50_06295 [Steroidobacteraceae bacterium]|nr:hypothetical protein [Steroidobacteraceae bacterium]